MPSTFSPNLRIELIGAGEQSGVWGTTTNNNLGDLIEQAISGATTLDVSASDFTLTAFNGVTDQSRSAVLIVTGNPGTTRTLTIPNVNKAYTVKNRSNSTVNIKTSTGVAYAVPTLSEAYIYCDGNNVITGRTITDGANTFTSNPAPLNNTALTGIPTAPTAAPGTNSTQIATTAFVNTALPIGSVIMWYGAAINVPTGWQICNGTNGTPDLRDRFVVGAGSTYALGDTGGANSVTLTTNEIPSHTHTGTTATASTAHNHTFSATTGLSGAHSHTGTTNTVDLAHTHSGTTASASIAHTHTFSGSGGTGDAGSHNHTGTTGNAGNHQHGLTVDADSGASGGPFFKADSQAVTTNFTNFAGEHAHGFTTSTVGNHTHTVSVSGTTGSTDPSHSHTFTTGAMSANATHSHTVTTDTASDHTHSVSGTTGAMSANETHTHTFTTNATGGGLAHENRPPYVALFYIMRV